MSQSAPSLKATENRRKENEKDPLAGLKQAQADYKEARAGFRADQRKILQGVFRNVSALIQDDAARRSFMKDRAITKYADPAADEDRGGVWFRAIAFVYQSTSRAARKRASKHASALRLLYDQEVDADQIATTIKRRGGIQKLADEAAKCRRKAQNQSDGEDNAEPEADDSVVDGAESGGAEEEQVRFDISDELAAKIRKWPGQRIKIIAQVSTKVRGKIKVLRAVKVKAAEH